MRTPDTIYHNETITRDKRNQLNGHKSVVIWFTGLSSNLTFSNSDRKENIKRL